MRGDLPPKVFTNSQRLFVLPGASVLPSDVDSVPPGGVSGAVTLTFGVSADFENWTQSLTVRALRAAPLIPAKPPEIFPDSLIAPRRLIKADSVPGPFARDLIRVRFSGGVPLAVRQRFVDRTHGRLVGGVRNSAGEGDYVLQVPDSPDGRGVFEAWRNLGQGAPRIVARRGVVMLASSAAPPFPPLPQGPVALDPWARAGVHVNFAADADSLERAATLAQVGARVRASDGGLGGELVVGRDSTPAGIAILARRLTYLPAVTGVFAWTSSGGKLETISFGSAPPVDSGQAASDPAVRRFVDALALPSVHAIRDILFLPSHGLLFFSVTYGEAMDVYPSVVVVRHGRRIGLLGSSPQIAGPRFTLRRDDMVLADPAVVDTLEALEGPPETRRFALYGYVILPWLVEDSLVPAHVLRRCVRRIYRNDVGCSGSRVALAAIRIKDLVTLTQLSFLSGRWFGDGDAIQPARAGLRQLAPVILADVRSPRATLFALAQSVSVARTDSVLVARLMAHPAVQRDASVLAVLAQDRPWVLRKLVALLPGGPETHAAIESLFLRWGPDPPRDPDREAVVAVLADPVLGRDPAILAAIANAPPIAFPAASAEAGRRLPDAEFRRGAYLSEPPRLP